MLKIIAIPVLASLAALAACGGGGNGGNGFTPPHPIATTIPAQSNTPLQDAVAGALAFVNPANHHTLYFIDGDTPPGTACSGSCTSEWPVLTPTASAAAQDKLIIVTRTDGTRQWSFNGHALYEFSGDSGEDETNGVYGPWHIARPSTT